MLGDHVTHNGVSSIRPSTNCSADNGPLLYELSESCLWKDNPRGGGGMAEVA